MAYGVVFPSTCAKYVLYFNLEIGLGRVSYVHPPCTACVVAWARNTLEGVAQQCTGTWQCPDVLWKSFGILTVLATGEI